MTNGNPRNQRDLAEAPMEQVREILFGAQLKDMEARFRRQEDRFLREIDDVKESMKKRLDSLENFMKSEVSSILGRIREEQAEREENVRAERESRLEAQRAEQRERAEAVKNEQRERLEALSQISADLAGASENFERKLAKLANTLDVAERELRSLLLTESGSLTDKIERKYADALGVMAKTAAQIRSDMVHRTSLSSMLTEMVVALGAPWDAEPSGDRAILDAAHEGRGDEPRPHGHEHGEHERHHHDEHHHDEHHHQEHHHEHHNHEDRQPGEGGEGMPPQVLRLGSADNY